MREKTCAPLKLRCSKGVQERNFTFINLHPSVQSKEDWTIIYPLFPGQGLETTMVLEILNAEVFLVSKSLCPDFLIPLGHNVKKTPLTHHCRGLQNQAALLSPIILTHILCVLWKCLCHVRRKFVKDLGELWTQLAYIKYPLLLLPCLSSPLPHLFVLLTCNVWLGHSGCICIRCLGSSGGLWQPKDGAIPGSFPASHDCFYSHVENKKRVRKGTCSPPTSPSTICSAHSWVGSWSIGKHCFHGSEQILPTAASDEG